MAGKIAIFTKADLILTLAGAARQGGRRVKEADLGFLEKASMVCRDGRLEWIGPHRRLPKQYARARHREVELKGSTVLPGLVECHTHLVFAGDRAAEFEQRNQGVSYQEIAARGGGILSTMKRTRAASTAELARLAQHRADVFAAQGVTTLEVKSGYALNLKDELRQLEAAGRLKGPRVRRTFLAAHALPPEFKTYEEYLEFLGQEVLPAVKRKKLAERVDIFVEKGFFPAEASRRYLEKAKALGFQTLIHADQLSLSGGTRLAVELGSLSADHVIQVGEGEIRALAASETTAVLLPSADLYMKCAYPPARQMIDAGVRVALATDFNPGTSPSQDVNLVGLLARLEMKMTLPEVISAYTVGAAHALGRAQEIGSLEVGKCADFVNTTADWRTLFYSVGERSYQGVYCQGSLIN
ncbi:MAG: imidazolonepropionase [Bdellovibrionaceae bacterium]|nr:imidazolonepropionase [Pseudobdellovibrionaceae bacterium]